MDVLGSPYAPGASRFLISSGGPMFRPGHPTGGATRTRVVLLRRVAQSAGTLAAAAALVFTISPPAAAQATGRIAGVVTDSATDRPVSDVQVVVVGTRIGGVTDAQGRYTIAGAPAGTRSIEARRIGYRVGRVTNVNVQDGGTVTVDIKIVAIALT